MSDRWETARLSDLVEIVIGGTPSRAMPAFWAEKPAGHPWLAISDLREKFLSDTREHITDLGVRSSNVKLIPAGSTVMSFKLSVGRTAITEAPMFSNEAIAAFLPRSAAINSAWLYHALPRAAGTVVTDSAVKGATLNKAKMAEMIVSLPSPAEQQVLANILDTLDTSIRQTEAIIEKLKQVKQGLLHDLLTRGVDANGELRPPQREAPQLYMDSPLGPVPRAWRVERASEVCHAVIDCKNRTPPETTSGHAVIRTPNVRHGRFERDGLTFTDPISYEIWTHRGKPIPGDVLITREAPVGEVCLLPADMDAACLGQRMMMYRPNADILTSEFMLIALLSARVQKLLADLAGGSTVGHVRVADIRGLYVPVPPLSEQKKIVPSYAALEGRLSDEEATLAKLKHQKIGLMDDLLSGRVRVTSLLDTAVA